MSELPLFPLRAVLFPDGLLGLKVFEARYLDMVGDCLRSGGRFGVVALAGGSGEGPPAEPPAWPMERCGVAAELLEVDSPQPGILQVRARGLERFTIESAQTLRDGLWLGDVSWRAADESVELPPALQSAAQALAVAIDSLDRQGSSPFLAPYRLDDAGWVANRWCEILPISLGAKYRLMALDDPLARLRLVDEYLRAQHVID